jgi:3-oxoacyl-[acyl-carrier protein] reductase
MQLKNRTAIVTGASSGIGKAVALKLGSQGANVCINYFQDSSLDDAKWIAEQIVQSGGGAICIQADMAILADIRKLIDETIRHFGALDILVNNAAYALLKPIREVTEVEYDYLFQVNAKGVFFASQFAAEKMRYGGKIVNISSATTGLTLNGYGLYDATKGAVEVFSRILARELGPRNISVNVISPGATETEQFRLGKSDQFIQELSAMSHFNRIARPEEIAEVIAFCCSDESGWMTGQNIRVNGGTC